MERVAKEENYFRLQLSLAKQSLRSLGPSSLLLLLLDFLFYALSFGLIFFFAIKLTAQYNVLSFPSELEALSPIEAQNLLSSAKEFYYSLLGSIALGFFGIVFLYTLFKGMIWSILARNRTRPLFFVKFFGLNLLWLGFWSGVLLLFAFISNIVELKYLIFSFFGLFIIFTNSLNFFFAHSPSFSSLNSSLRFTFSHFHSLILPYFSLLALFLLFTNLLSLLPPSFGRIVTLGFCLLFFLLSRIYLWNLLSHYSHPFPKKQALNRKS